MPEGLLKEPKTCIWKRPTTPKPMNRLLFKAMALSPALSYKLYGWGSLSFIRRIVYTAVKRAEKKLCRPFNGDKVEIYNTRV